MEEKTLKEKIEFIRNMQNNTIDDEYDTGFYNGIEYALSVLENREAVYKEYKRKSEWKIAFNRRLQWQTIIVLMENL